MKTINKIVCLLLILGFLNLNCAIIYKSVKEQEFVFNDATIENVEWQWLIINTIFSALLLFIDPPLAVASFILTNCGDLESRAAFKNKDDK